MARRRTKLNPVVKRRRRQVIEGIALSLMVAAAVALCYLAMRN